MDKNEIKTSRNEVSRIVKKPVENIYGLASLYRVFFARVIDLIIVAIPVIIVTWAWRGMTPNITGSGTQADPYNFQNFDEWHKNAYLHTGVGMAVELVSILLFLVFIPSFTKGTTIGKAICGIRLRRSKGDKKVKWYMLLARESYFLLVPWFIAIVISLISWGILVGGNHNGIDPAAYWIGAFANIFYMFWFIFLLINIKVQSEHQSGIDMKFGLFVVYKEPIKQITKEVEVKETSIILTDEPGNLSKENLDELRNDEKHKFDKSISLEDLDIEIVEEKSKPKDQPKKLNIRKKEKRNNG